MGIEMGSMSLMENLYFSAAGAWQAGAFLLHLCSAAFGFLCCWLRRVWVI